MTSTMTQGTATETREVVTAFLEHEGKILIVRRSQRVGTYQGRWSGISGYLEHEPLEQALIEIREETGLNESDVELVTRGEPLEIADSEHNLRWLVYPFLFSVKQPDAISLDWENLELRWITPAEIDDYPTVPALKETLARCLNDAAT
ncbi:MAG: NUDIX domain-containing protein [Acidiferrobacterales bacterium]